MSQTNTYSLYELTNAMRRCVEHSFDGRYWIHAEVSECKRNSISGHSYLELIEKGTTGNTVAKVKAIIWAQTYAEITNRFISVTGMKIAPGMEILMLVAVSFHEQFGFSLIIHNVDPTYTMGEAARKRQETIARLKAEGLFEQNRQLIPNRPLQCLAIISSATAAGYEDFLNHLEGSTEGYRFYTRLYTAIMQGEGTEESVIAALECISRHQDQYDAVVIIRGGGAVSDLAAFDSYAIAVAAARFPLPIIVGIGHDRDESVVDLVAAISLKTPTAVADHLVEQMRREDALITNLAACVSDGCRLLSAAYIEHLSRLAYRLPILLQQNARREEKCLTDLRTRMLSAGLTYIDLRKQRVERIQTTLPLVGRSVMERQLACIDGQLARLQTAINTSRQQQLIRINAIAQAIRISHPDQILKRGFAIIRSNQGIVSRAANLPAHADITLQFADGIAQACTSHQTAARELPLKE